MNSKVDEPEAPEGASGQTLAKGHENEAEAGQLGGLIGLGRPGDPGDTRGRSGLSDMDAGVNGDLFIIESCESSAWPKRGKEPSL